MKKTDYKLYLKLYIKHTNYKILERRLYKIYLKIHDLAHFSKKGQKGNLKRLTTYEETKIRNMDGLLQNMSLHKKLNISDAQV